MAKDLDLTADYIDVRDIIARVEELRESYETWRDLAEGNAATEGRGVIDTPTVADWAVVDGDGAELAQLESLLDEMKGNGGDEQWEGDWYPVTLIRDSYFEQSMDELLEDIGDIPKDIPCYLKIVVDYDALKTDYTSIEIGDETYWYR